MDLKVKNIDSWAEYESKLENTFNLDDLHFKVPAKTGEDMVSLHLDFNDLQWYYDDVKNVLSVQLKELAETWTNLNMEEESYDNSEISVELLKKGYLENYVLFINQKDGSVFTDIEVKRIGYFNENNEVVLLKISEEAVNEADI